MMASTSKDRTAIRIEHDTQVCEALVMIGGIIFIGMSYLMGIYL